MPGSTADAKSLKRVVHLLEAFARARGPMGSGELGAIMASPRSSTAGLLRALVDLDVLTLDRRTRTYLPSPRLTTLTSWIDDVWRPAFYVLERLDRLRAATDLTIFLTTPSDASMTSVPCDRHEAPSVVHVVGSSRPMMACASGIAYLASLPSSHVARLSKRLAPVGGLSMSSFAELRRRMRAARSLGAAVMEGADGQTAIAFVLPHGAAARTLVVEIEGPTDRVRFQQAALVSELRALGESTELIDI